MPKLIQATIQSLNENEAVLRLEDGLEVVWPVTHLPEGSKEGSLLHLIGGDTQAKALLNELLEEEES